MSTPGSLRSSVKLRRTRALAGSTKRPRLGRPQLRRDDLARRRSSHSASSGTGRWLGTATGRQPERSGGLPASACRSSRMSRWIAMVERSESMRCTCRGVKAASATSTSAADDLPAPAPRVLARELRPAERARAAGDRQQRGGQQQVAPEDRQAGRGEHAEGHERDDPGRDRQAHAVAQQPEAEQPAGQRRRTAPARARSRRAGAARSAARWPARSRAGASRRSRACR